MPQRSGSGCSASCVAGLMVHAAEQRGYRGTIEIPYHGRHAACCIPLGRMVHVILAASWCTPTSSRSTGTLGMIRQCFRFLFSGCHTNSSGAASAVCHAPTHPPAHPCRTSEPEIVCTSGGCSEEEVCYICLDGPRPGEPLVRPCTCPRCVHHHCLAKWQLNCAGKE